MLGGSWQIDAYLYVIAAVLGLVMGSFLHAFAWRLARGESICRGRSHCPFCGHLLQAWDLIPVISWCFQKGRCRYCKRLVPVRYPLIELLTAGLFVSLFWRYHFSWQLVEYLVLCCLLLLVALIDYDSWLIPDGLLIAGLLLYIPLAWLVEDSVMVALWTGLSGGLAIFLPLYLLVILADKITGKETMGGGDLKLFFVIGCYLGPFLVMINLLAACLLGIVFQHFYQSAHADHAFPFGPSIAAGTWFTLLWGESLLRWYFQVL